MQLRKTCNHADLIQEQDENPNNTSVSYYSFLIPGHRGENYQWKYLKTSNLLNKSDEYRDVTIIIFKYFREKDHSS